MFNKKAITLLAACCVTLSLAACGSSSSSGSSSDNASSQAEEQEVRAVEEPESNKEEEAEEKQAAQADVAVTIDNATLGEDYDGKPVVIVTYTFSNISSDEAESFMLSCNSDVYQNGVECELAFVTGLEGDSSANVKKGGSNTFQQAYLIEDRSEIEVEVKELFSWDDTLLASATFSFE